MELDPNQVYDFLSQLGILVTLIANSLTLWDKVKPYFHGPRKLQRFRKRHR